MLHRGVAPVVYLLLPGSLSFKPTNCLTPQHNQFIFCKSEICLSFRISITALRWVSSGISHAAAK